MIMVLVDKNDKPVNVGDELTDFRGDKLTLTGWAAPPRDSGSTGRIFTSKGSFYPSVCNLKFIEAK